MKLGRWTLALALSGAALAPLALASRSHAQTAAPAHRPPLSDSWLPLDDGRVRIYETRGPGGGRGVVGFEIGTAGTERLPDGETWTIVDTYTTSLGSVTRRLVQREWLRATSTAILCARRAEGPIVSDLVPVQTVLQLPVAAGASWTWEGTSGGKLCRRRTRVAGSEVLANQMGHEHEAWRVEDETEGLATPGHVKRTLWYVRGLGVVAERSEITLPEFQRILEAKLVSFRF